MDFAIFIKQYSSISQLILSHLFESISYLVLIKLVIRVKDNGSGIPQEVLDKIFLPFSTKPTGQGTELGLSLSYDIVKAHDGVPSRPGSYRELLG